MKVKYKCSFHTIKCSSFSVSSFLSALMFIKMQFVLKEQNERRACFSVYLLLFLYVRSVDGPQFIHSTFITPLSEKVIVFWVSQDFLIHSNQGLIPWHWSGKHWSQTCPCLLVAITVIFCFSVFLCVFVCVLGVVSVCVLGGLGAGERLRTRQIPNCTNVWNDEGLMMKHQLY